MSFKKSIAMVCTVALISIVTGCSTQIQDQEMNVTAPPAEKQPNLIDEEMKNKSQKLIEEWKKLANLRQVKQETALRADKKVSAQINKKFSGLETEVSYFNCHCDLKTAMQSVATLLDWDMDKVFEVGMKPAQGVPVEVTLKEQPLTFALEQIDVQVGHFVDIRLDPNFKTILITYRALDAPREAHK